MKSDLRTELTGQLESLERAGLLRNELALGEDGSKDGLLINLATHNYLGLATDSKQKSLARGVVERQGLSMSAARFEGGSLGVHEELAKEIADIMSAEGCLLFASHYHACVGLFEALFDDRDNIFCDVDAPHGLADGVRLCGARVFPFTGRAMKRLEDLLKRSGSSRYRVVVTSGVYGADGTLSPLKEMQVLADTYDAVLVVDESHGLGALGADGAGAASHHGLGASEWIRLGSLDYGLGAGAGGFIAGPLPVTRWLRQRSRPYLVDTAPTPVVSAAALAALQAIRSDGSRLERLRTSTQAFREALSQGGAKLVESPHPIVGIRLPSAAAVQRGIDELLGQNLLVSGACPPLLPEGDFIVRAQISTRHPQRMLAQYAGTIAQVLSA